MKYTGNTALQFLISLIKNKFATKSDVGHTHTPASIGAASSTHDHSKATSSSDGFMSKEDKSKIDTIEQSANNYTHPSQHSADILVDGTTNKVVTGTEKTTWNAKESALNAVSEKASIIDADGVVITDSAASNASKRVLWSTIKATLKTYFDTLYTTALLKLTGYSKAASASAIATTDSINVAFGKLEKGLEMQADYNQADNTSNDFIKNKPTLGTLAAKDSVGTDDIADGAVTNAKMAQMMSGTIKGVASHAYGGQYNETPQDLTPLQVCSMLGNPDRTKLVLYCSNEGAIVDTDHVYFTTPYTGVLPNGAAGDEYMTLKKIAWADLKALFAVVDTVVTAAAASWTGTEAPYTIVLTVDGVTADSKLDVGLSEASTDAQFTACAEAQIRATACGAGTVTLKALGTLPTVDIPILVRRVG